MAKPKYCPVLSKPALSDTTATGAMVKCKGKNCALFRVADEVCLLDDIPTVGSASEVMQVVEEMPSTAELQTAIEAIERIEETVTGSSSQIESSISSLSEEVRAGSGRVEEALEDLVPVIKDITQSMAHFREVSREMDLREKELTREKEKARVTVKALMLYREGLENFHAGRKSAAIRSLRECLILGDEAPVETEAVLGTALVAGGELEEGMRLLEKAAAAEPALALPMTNLAHARLLDGKLEQAEEAAREALRRDPLSGAAQNTLGNALFALGRTPEAIEAWHRAVEIDPSLEAARENLRRQRILPFPELQDQLTG
jgi:Flp pilus assembly protein TadD